MSAGYVRIGCIVLAVFSGSIGTAHAERWIQAGPADSRIWYDADNIHPTGNSRIGVWISTGPNRTNPGRDGATVYPTYSIVDCRDRTAGPKIGIDTGDALRSFPANSGMGELIAKVCPSTAVN